MFVSSAWDGFWLVIVGDLTGGSRISSGELDDADDVEGFSLRVRFLEKNELRELCFSFGIFLSLVRAKTLNEDEEYQQTGD